MLQVNKSAVMETCEAVLLLVTNDDGRKPLAAVARLS